ncbi:MAG: hypothetical protein MUF23_07700 [Pirellula sp.]|jgi:RNA polymerase sigma factor (sigma-70 family)|nr:hypothetical protein [Pirellula sp.]
MQDLSSEAFGQRLARLRSGEPEEVEWFVRQYEPYLRRAIRFRLSRTALKAIADSVDVCQSVLSGFLLRLSAGDYQIECEQHLKHLLISIANKKFLMLNRRESAAKRDRDQTVSLSHIPEVAAPQSENPASGVELKELMTEVRNRLNADELRLLELRRSGKSWREIAEEIHEEEPLLRQRLSRAIRRVAAELHLDY